VSPSLFKKLARIESLNPNISSGGWRSLHTALSMLPQGGRALISVRQNLPDGILVHSYWDQSIKQDMALGLAANPVMLGLIGAMAIPAFQKVRASSQEKTVLNNLRQLSAASDQYYLENGVDHVPYAELVGRDKYIKVINSVSGEDYTRIVFKQGEPLRVFVPSLNRVVEYVP
jgi:type IV pilus assembly protein PilA